MPDIEEQRPPFPPFDLGRWPNFHDLNYRFVCRILIWDGRLSFTDTLNFAKAVIYKYLWIATIPVRKCFLPNILSTGSIHELPSFMNKD
jgi:hypothetical protein